MTLDRVLYRLWELVRERGADDGISKWSAELGQDAESGNIALAVLQKADLFPSTPKDLPTNEAPFPYEPVPHDVLISVILFGGNSEPLWDSSLESLASQSNVNMEVLAVGDHARLRLRSPRSQNWPLVHWIPSSPEENGRGSLNKAVERAQGDYLLFLENGVSLAPGAIELMFERSRGEDSVGAVIPMIRSAAQPKFVHTLGSRFGFNDVETFAYCGHLVAGQFVDARRVAMASFSAALVPRSALTAVGDIDEHYQTAYRDIDWFWRARLKGLNLLAETQGLVYQRTKHDEPENGLDTNLRIHTDRLRFVSKNLHRGRAARTLIRSLQQDIAVAIGSSLRRKQPGFATLSKAWSRILFNALEIRRQRRHVQKQRLVPDKVIFDELQAVPRARQDQHGPVLKLSDVIEDYGPYLLERGESGASVLGKERVPPRLLIVSHDVVNKNMAGPGIRCWELAHALARHLQVTLAVPTRTDLASSSVRLETYDGQNEGALAKLASVADVVLATQDLIHRFPSLGAMDKALVMDLYDPALLENLDLHRDKSLSDREGIHGLELGILLDIVRRGDFFICASERQRDFWLGVLLAARRVNPSTYERDPSLLRLIDVVPFGIPSRPPRASHPAVKGVIPGINEDDKVIYWGGGIWNWLDPLTPIRAMARVAKMEARARLFFLAGRHPNPVVPEMQMAVRAQRVAEDLGLLNRFVFFHHQWVPYQERANYLLEADLAVSAHLQHIETRFSFRTRLLDCIWAGLPMVVSDGDAVAEWVRKYRLGMVVDPGDDEATAEAIVSMLNVPDGKSSLSSGFDELRSQLTWDRVAEPLVRFCTRPHRAIDLSLGMLGASGAPTSIAQPTRVLGLPARFFAMMREHGIKAAMRQTSKHLSWRWSQWVR